MVCHSWIIEFSRWLKRWTIFCSSAEDRPVTDNLYHELMATILILSDPDKMRMHGEGQLDIRQLMPKPEPKPAQPVSAQQITYVQYPTNRQTKPWFDCTKLILFLTSLRACCPEGACPLNYVRGNYAINHP